MAGAPLPCRKREVSGRVEPALRPHRAGIIILWERVLKKGRERPGPGKMRLRDDRAQYTSR